MQQNSSTPTRITCALIDSLQSIVQSCGATAIFVHADALAGMEFSIPEALQDQVFYIVRDRVDQLGQSGQNGRLVRVPNVNLTRVSQLKIAVFLAVSQDIVRRGDVIVCLTGMPSSGALDTLIITEVGRDSEILASVSADAHLPSGVRPEVVERLIDIAVELGTEGREGKPIGTLFVVGDAARAVSLSRQLIINPFKGYLEEERNILDSALEETVKELSTIDGAFIIEGNGVIVTCGAYLRTLHQEEPEFPLPNGLGARHHAAAGITAVTDSLAITVSESTGSVTVFRNGHIVIEIEKPRSQRQRGA